MTAPRRCPPVIGHLTAASVVAALSVATLACGIQRVDDRPVAPTTTATVSTSAPTSTVDRPITSTSTSSVPTSTTTTEPPPTIVWSDSAPPSGGQRTLLEQTSVLFAPPASCRPIRDQDFDELGTYPQGPDDATIECTYPGHATIVFSLFASDAAMVRFFEARLPGRDLAHGAGRIGPSPGWELDHRGDQRRGSGSIFGTQRLGEGARSEIGWIRTGTRTYAYSYARGTDFAGYYRWWASVFGGPAPPG